MSLVYLVGLKRFLTEIQRRRSGQKFYQINWYTDETNFYSFIDAENCTYHYQCKKDNIPEPLRMFISGEGEVLGILDSTKVKQEEEPTLPKISLSVNKL